VGVSRRQKRMSRAARAQLGYGFGVLSAATGIGLELGLGWGLVAGGAVAAASFLLLAETDEKGEQGVR
jgi:hypothetical protein